jgi:hypothetical protein
LADTWRCKDGFLIQDFTQRRKGRRKGAKKRLILDLCGSGLINRFHAKAQRKTQIDSDVYVIKLNPSGTALIYTALIRGSSDEQARDLALDSGGNVYVTGDTLSTDFPTVNAMQPSRGDNDVPDVFVFKLNSSGDALSYSTYLGGNGFDTGDSIAVNATGNAFVTGTTGSSNFPVANALQPVNNSGDAFVSKFSPRW